MKSALVFLMVVVPVFGAEPKTVGEAEMAFNKEYNTAKEEFDAKVKVAQDKFVVFLKEEMKRLTAKGDLDGAVAIRDKIKSMEIDTNTTTTKSNKPNMKINLNQLVGNYTTSPKYRFDYNLKIDNNKLVLTEESGNKSIDCNIIDTNILFRWSGGNHIIVISLLPEMTITCYANAFNGSLENIPDKSMIKVLDHTKFIRKN